MATTQIKIGNYTLLETLGVVAIHSQTGHKVALKLVNRRKIANLDMTARIKREIQYMRQLRHPHIIKLYEVITTPTDVVLVLEHAGGELFNYIVDRGRMGEDEARRFFQQLICAVEFCHLNHIVHRDLKPENVLLDEWNQVKIGDFGLSNLMMDGDFLKTSCGSPNYAAPEVINGRLYEGPEIDVWSCGVILYVMLCGRLPFDDDYIPNLFKKINSGMFLLPSYLSPATRSLLLAMLTVDPLKRITFEQIRKNEWFNVNLPDYLKSAKKLAVSMGKTDMSIVAEISKDAIVYALHASTNNQIKVAYQLMYDYKLVIKSGSFVISPQEFDIILVPVQPSTTGFKPFSFGSGASSRNTSVSRTSGISSRASMKEDRNTSIQVRGSRFAQKPDPNVPVKKKSRSKWHFGIRSRSPPFDIMLEIYRALQNCGMTWKSIDPFLIRVRHVAAGKQVVKLDVQLYRVEKDNYLVDFKMKPDAAARSAPVEEGATEDAIVVGGKVQTNLAAFAFFDACSRLITELAISA
ncbi:5-AMP-activated protein kinase, catalytic [Entophlyctis sp. JEL0112]|nr:5-AMP-activated protein kinase, catalytic [Entophlyctis sp. JEL0112]